MHVRVHSEPQPSSTRDMLKRQRPATPPPSLLGDLPSFVPSLLKVPPPSDPSQPHSKRQRVRPPPLDGALRGWLQSEPTGAHPESDGEEDWIEEAHDASSPLPSSGTTVDRYKDANSLLHELHVLNQQRLLFAGSSLRNCPPNLDSKALPLASQRSVACIDQSPDHSSSQYLIRDQPMDPNYCAVPAEDEALIKEVQRVRQRYEDANRFLGSLFLLRRREVEGMISSGKGS